jgi:hypothetical protein
LYSEQKQTELVSKAASPQPISAVRWQSYNTTCAIIHGTYLLCYTGYGGRVLFIQSPNCLKRRQQAVRRYEEAFDPREYYLCSQKYGKNGRKTVQVRRMLCAARSSRKSITIRFHGGK